MKRVLVFVLSILVAFSFAFARDMDRPGQENLLEKIQQMAPPEREATLHQRGWVQVQLPYVHSYQDLIPAYVRENMPPEMLDKVIQAAMEKEMEQPFADMAKINRWIPSEKDFAKVFREQAQSKFGSGDGHNACNFSSARKGDALLVHNGFTAWGFYAHAGIWYGGTGTYATIESNANESYFGDPNPGVHYEPASHWNDDYDYCRLMRVNTWPLSTSYRAKAADYARDQLGKPYNFNWVWKWSTSKFYCSQLVWAGYYRTSKWYARIDIDANPADTWVAPDELFYSWRTSTVASSW
ncbi:MAG: hypothetical protein DRJ14_01660 [Acidobacteria bacterium]|nr:MAG: hypothetical protein DRJ14_01660 [Acidobacteriota bacterium]